jgi:hypothetical protein
LRIIGITDGNAPRQRHQVAIQKARWCPVFLGTESFGPHKAWCLLQLVGDYSQTTRCFWERPNYCIASGLDLKHLCIYFDDHFADWISRSTSLPRTDFAGPHLRF